MITIKADFTDKNTILGLLGRVGENGTRQIEFDCSEILTEYPAAVIVCAVKRPGEESAYYADMQAEGALRRLILRDVETEKPGTLKLELSALDGEKQRRTTLYAGAIASGLTRTDEEPSDPEKDLIDYIANAESVKQEASNAAKDALAAAGRAADAASEIENMTANAVTLASGEPATANYNAGVLTIGVPKGDPGPAGPQGEPGQDAPQDAVLYTPQALTTEQQAQARDNIGAAGADDVQQLAEDMTGKLAEPAEGLAVGKYFRVAAIDANGHAVLEAVDAKDVGVQDVLINNESIISNGAADIKVNTANGLEYDGVYGLRTVQASPPQIDARLNKQLAVTPNNIDYAVKAAMCDGKGAAWTADEQAAARERIGASKGTGTFDDIATVTTTEEVSAITINSDSNGNPFSLSDIICEITFPSEDPTKTRHIYFGCKILTEYAFSRIALPTNASYITGAIAYARIVYGRIICEGAIAGISNTRHQSYNKYAIFNGHGSIKAESFDSVSVFTYSNNFPAGTTFTLKGARK